MNTVQAAPPKSINTHRTKRLRKLAVLKITAANVAVAMETTPSIESADLARGRATAPSTAPAPKKPSNKPYAIGLLLSSFATIGSRAQKELAKKMRHPDRTNNVRMPGELRT
jgi:hypothetical protein